MNTSRNVFRPFTRVLFSAALVVSLFAFNQGHAQKPGSAPSSKIAPWVLEHTANGTQAEFLIVLADQADLRGAETMKTKEDKGHFVRNVLWDKAQATQGPLLKWLSDHQIEHRSFYIVNLIWVKGNLDLAQAMAARPDVLRVEGNPQIHNDISEPLPAEIITSQPDTTEAVEPGITYTHAPLVWALGYTGQGIVVGGADTGIRWTHNALKPNYRGWNGTVANHNFNWHDSIHNSSSNPCGNDSPQPCDDYFHGTHTIATAVGSDGGANQIGMAPGAKWIGCRNMDQGNGTPARYIECMEFFLAPYPIGGNPNQGNPTLAPDITTNSWACPASEGCSVNSLQAAVEAQRAAGIMMVVAATNSGPSCSTISDPPSFYDASYTVGALNTSTDTVASFSSRGPVTADGSNRTKPDIAAPGTSTRSATNSSDTAYTTASGTSMATPHIAGAVALLWSARPILRHNISMTEDILNQSAVHITSTLCSSSGSPNNTYGNGRVDIKAAVDHLLLTGAVSRKTHGSGTFDVTLPLTGAPGVECRSSGGNHTIVFTFDNTMVSGNASVTSGTGSVAGSPTFSGNTMTVNLTGVADVQKITVMLSGATDNLAQVLPDTAVSMNMLIGDTNGDKTVSNSDVSQTKAQSGAALTAANFREDVTVDGSISNSDISLVKSRSGTGVP